MRPFDDDYEDLDEFDFDSFAAAGPLTNEKRRPRHRAAGRKHHSKAHKERWENDYSDRYDYDDYSDYYDDEFDKYYGINIKH
jgi:hypothetical protein